MSMIRLRSIGCSVSHGLRSQGGTGGRGAWRPWRHARLVAASLVLAAATPCTAQGVRYVDDDAARGGDGLAWSTAFDDLQPALAAATASGGVITEIRLAQGTYIPSQRTDAEDPRSATFQLVNGVTLRGGYVGISAPNPGHWDPDRYVTRLDGEFDDVRRYHVLLAQDLAVLTTIDAVHVSRGAATGTEPDSRVGGGLPSLNSVLLVERSMFYDNTAISGAGLHAKSSTLDIRQCHFRENEATNSGGGIRVIDCQFTVDESTFLWNLAAFGGAGIDGNSASAQGPFNQTIVIRHTTFEANEVSQGAGGGLRVVGTAATTTTDSTFRENFAPVGGGADIDGRYIAERCTFERNESLLGGGGLSASSDNDSIYVNLAFIENETAWFGGGCLLLHTQAPLVNCIFDRNVAGYGGGLFGQWMTTLVNCTLQSNQGGAVMITDSSNLTTTNCILWGNMPDQIMVHGGEPPIDAGPPITVSHCAIEGGWSGAGSNNLATNPQLVRGACGNLRLSHESACLNAGSNAALPSGVVTDLDGMPRVQDGTIDIGAYEGGFPAESPMACADSISMGDMVSLVPSGNQPNSLLRAEALLLCFSLEPEESAQFESLVDGGSRLNSSIADGMHITRIEMPFGVEDLGGDPPFDRDLLTSGAGGEQWVLAAQTNVHTSPGHRGPLGDRSEHLDNGEPYMLSPDFGDYGVVWNPGMERGYVWANVDHTGKFQIGQAILECPPDCAQPANGVVDVQDVFAVLDAWGTLGVTPEDVDDNGVVNADDLLAVVGAWGPCPASV